MGKTPASTRAGRKPKSKNQERKWCICQERCNGGKDVAASTYRSHNPTTARPTITRGSSVVEGNNLVGGKRKVMDDEGGAVRETRRMRARRMAQNVEVRSQLSGMVVEDPVRILDPDDAKTGPQERKKVDDSSEFHSDELTTRPQYEHHQEVRIHEYAGGDVEGDEDEDSAWIPSVEAYYPIENGKEIDEDYEGDDQLRATLRAINEMVSAILSWD